MPDKLDVLREYVECKAIVKEAEEKMKGLAELIKSFAEVDQVYEVDGAKVSCMRGKAKYRYSPETTEKEKALKATMKEEIQMGIAESEYGEPYLVVKFTA